MKLTYKVQTYENSVQIFEYFVNIKLNIAANYAKPSSKGVYLLQIFASRKKFVQHATGQ